VTNDRLARIRSGAAIGPADAEWLLGEIERLRGALQKIASCDTRPHAAGDDAREALRSSHEPLPVASFPKTFVSDELFAIARDCPMSATARTKLQALCPRIGELETISMNAAPSEVTPMQPQHLITCQIFNGKLCSCGAIPNSGYYDQR
jgi:hypothetical protein